jgi:hypothetical protein
MDKPTEESIRLWKYTSADLKGSERRKFRARVVRSLGWGGQCFAVNTLGWSRENIRKGEGELTSGMDVQDQFHLRGRKPSEYHFPELLNDLKSIIEPYSQTDPTFRSTRIYTPLSAGEVRDRLHKNLGYKLSTLPCERTIRNKLNALGFILKKSQNTVP